MLRIKDDTVFPSTQWALLLAIVVVDQVYSSYGITETVITSLNDGKHSDTSLHFSDNAFDVRTKNISQDIDKRHVAAAIKAKLNIHFDVVLEADHLHVEFQPRGNKR